MKEERVKEELDRKERQNTVEKQKKPKKKSGLVTKGKGDEEKEIF